ncbi:phytanoyl-CoA dioxygenase family protein [Candidatus Poribacteria bacterium]|nr:phytanoyl-CoA dioxygenase family protein [Candidatus Poribacteria bacterium]
MNTLTDAQLAFYDENGFLIVDPVFDEDELVALREAADELLKKSGPIIRGNPRLEIEPEMQDGELIVRKIEPIIDVVPALYTLTHDERLTTPAAQIFGEPVVLFEDKLNYKPPHVGSAYPLHQDYSYWLKYTNRLITVVLHFDDATPENGCLRFVPGSHKQGIMERPTGDAHVIAWELEDSSVAVDASGEAGSLVLFSCYTAHHSFPNRSDKGRRAILYTYNPASDGDTYPIYKGKHTKRCQEWLKTHQG